MPSALIAHRLYPDQKTSQGPFSDNGRTGVRVGVSDDVRLGASVLVILGRKVLLAVLDGHNVIVGRSVEVDDGVGVFVWENTKGDLQPGRIKIRARSNIVRFKVIVSSAPLIISDTWIDSLNFIQEKDTSGKIGLRAHDH